MKRHAQMPVVAFTLVFGSAAQAPAGWKMRIDHSTSAQDPDGAGSISFVTSRARLHATNPQRQCIGIQPATASGTYTLKGTFTLMKPSGHTNYYGLVFGGSDLEGSSQKYLYFMVSQNGTWLLKRAA